MELNQNTINMEVVKCRRAYSSRACCSSYVWSSEGLYRLMFYGGHVSLRQMLNDCILWDCSACVCLLLCATVCDFNCSCSGVDRLGSILTWPCIAKRAFTHRVHTSNRIEKGGVWKREEKMEKLAQRHLKQAACAWHPGPWSSLKVISHIRNASVISFTTAGPTKPCGQLWRLAVPLIIMVFRSPRLEVRGQLWVNGLKWRG